MTDTDALAAEMLAGLEGVTPGEWAVDECDTHSAICMPAGKSHVSKWRHLFSTLSHNDAAHLARCNPVNIRALLSEREEMKAEIERLQSALRVIQLMHDGNPPLPLADMPEIDYARRTIRNMHAEARAALKGADHD